MSDITNGLRYTLLINLGKNAFRVTSCLDLGVLSENAGQQALSELACVPSIFVLRSKTFLLETSKYR